ncbi:DUF2489 domain-containing protein [Gilvimarinus agarilyticus]|uniref:DUF2489 domain-containing protein n=1 Tax=Gilvimarinus agarilyticus TaxID=679259 RepID=UPI000697225F|nr:DUF2489 domain-containing protein [Gilvimarinus agarilyticus]
MSNSAITLLSVLGVAIIAALCVVAGYYLWQLLRLRQAQRAQLDKLAAESKAQRERVNTSIQVIAASVGREDLTLTEASIRISVLLDSLGVTDEVREEYSAFYQLRDATAHIPILEQWNKLPLAERRKFEKERLKHEQTYSAFILAAAERIRGQTF